MPSWKPGKETKEEDASLTASLGSTVQHPNIGDSQLCAQELVVAPIETKIRLSILATALVDALGGPVEFHRRFSYPPVTSMIPNKNFRLGPGVWTDDTSMTLCLARSLATYRENDKASTTGGFNEEHQVNAYIAWYEQGVLSAVDDCFDIGNTTRAALNLFAAEADSNEGLRRIREELAGENCAGNGSLMRVLPVGLAYWKDMRVAVEHAGRSSLATHPNEFCVEICEFWTSVISKVMQENSKGMGNVFTKLDLLEYISNYPFRKKALIDALTIPSDSKARSASSSQRETHYQTHHPLLRLIAKTQAQRTTHLVIGTDHLTLPTVKDVPSTGYVLHTVIAALYCFFATTSFQAGAVMTVNLGNDTDTVGAIYAGLAGCWYSKEKSDDVEGSFWTDKFSEWLSDLVRPELVEQVAEELVEFSKKQ